MKLQHIILALLFAAAVAGSIYVRSTQPPDSFSEAELLCRHAITTGNIVQARGCA